MIETLQKFRWFALPLSALSTAALILQAFDLVGMSDQVFEIVRLLIAKYDFLLSIPFGWLSVFTDLEFGRFERNVAIILMLFLLPAAIADSKTGGKPVIPNWVGLWLLFLLTLLLASAKNDIDPWARASTTYKVLFVALLSSITLGSVVLIIEMVKKQLKLFDILLISFSAFFVIGILIFAQFHAGSVSDQEVTAEQLTSSQVGANFGLIFFAAYTALVIGPPTLKLIAFLFKNYPIYMASLCFCVMLIFSIELIRLFPEFGRPIASSIVEFLERLPEGEH